MRHAEVVSGGDSRGVFCRGGDLGGRGRRFGENLVVDFFYAPCPIGFVCLVELGHRPVGGGDLRGDQGVVVFLRRAQADLPQYFQQCMDHVFQMRALRGFRIKMIHSDQFESCRAGAHKGHVQAQVLG